MKKLFATLLAATMVAGTAVSAFAYVQETPQGKDANGNDIVRASGDDDYTLSRYVYNDNGAIKTNHAIEGKDKIYYPILVSGDEIEKDADAGKWYYATAASEIDKLKVSIKPVRGGKYIKDAKIVKKDIGSKLIDINGNSAIADKKAELESAKTDLKNAETANETAKTSLAAAIAAIKKVNDKFAGTKVDDVKTEAAKHTELDLTESNAKLALAKTAKDAWEKETDDTEKTNKKTAFDNAVADVVTEIGKLDASFKGIKTFAEVEAKIADMKASNKNITDAKAAATTAETDAANVKSETEIANLKKAVEDKQKALDAVIKVPKVYCVEVELNDYFGTESTEVEFDLTLRTKSTQYETKDAPTPRPNTAFDLGEDAKEGTELKHGVDIFGDKNDKDKTTVKFRNNELTLGINKYTGSINLDEAYTAADKLEDVERIFLEGDDFDYEVKASDQGELYLEYNQDANKKVIIANQNAKMTFFNFPGKPEFDFTGDAKFTVEDPDKSYYFYEIVDDKPVKTSAKYDKEDECFVLRTRTLGSYVISDKELKAAENPADKDADKPATDKPTTETPVNPTTPGKNVPTGALA